MDEYMFNDFVDKCFVVDEATKYLEILNYSVSGRAILYSTGRLGLAVGGIWKNTAGLTGDD